MWFWLLGWEDPLEKEITTHSRFLPGKFHGQRSLSGYRPCGHKKSNTTEQLNNNKCSFGNTGIQKSKPSESQLLKWYSHFLHFLKFYWYEYSPSKTCIVLTVFGDLNALYLSASRRHLSCILFWQSLPFSCSSLFYSNSQVIGLAKKFVQIFSWWNVYYPRLYSGPFLYNLFFSQQPE